MGCCCTCTLTKQKKTVVLRLVSGDCWRVARVHEALARAPPGFCCGATAFVYGQAWIRSVDQNSWHEVHQVAANLEVTGSASGRMPLSLHYVAWLCLASWSEWILSGLWALHVAVRTSHPVSRRPGLVKLPCALQLRAHLWQCVSPDNIFLFALTYCVIWFTYWSRLCRSPLSMHFSPQVYTQWLSVRHSGTVLLHPHELRNGHLCPWRTWPGRLICFVEFAFAFNSFLLHLFECSCN